MKKILIVEDDKDINKALMIRLQAGGYEVISAEDGYTGLAKAMKEKPDLMLLDISLPAGDGFSIVERSRKNSESVEIPFIVLTASKRPDFKKTAMDLGASAYFEKPFESGALLEAICDAIDGRSVAPQS